MKIQTIVDGRALGYYEDSRGFVGARRLRTEYKRRVRQLHAAREARDECLDPARQVELETGIEQLGRAVEEASAAVRDYQG